MRITNHGFAFGLAAILSVWQTAAAADVSIEVSANRTQIYLGESVILSVRVSGVSSPPEPDLSAIKNCKVKLLGSQSQDQVSITIINGKMTRTGFFGRLFTYELTPDKTGDLLASPVRLTVDGKTLTAEGPLIKVTGLEEQDYVRIRINSSRETALIDDQFEITLSIQLKRLTGPHSGIDPLDPREPPRLQVPFLDDQPIEGLESPDIRKTLERILVPRPDQSGFAVNNYTVRSDPFDSMFDFDSFFAEKKPAKFQFAKQVVGPLNDCFEYTLKLSYRTRDEGSYTFGPVVFKGPVIKSIDSGNRISRQSIFAVGPACTVRVVPPPEEGRPLSFIGIIGTNLLAEAALDTQNCKVGDPLKLTVTVSGPANLRNARPPPLNAQADLRQDFRIYEDTVQTARKEDSVQFIYNIRPITAGTIELPGIEISYYDPDGHAYRTVKTKPIPVQAKPAPEVTIQDIIGLATNEISLPIAMAAGKLIVAPITMSAAGARHMPVHPSGRQILVALAGPLLFLGVVSVRSVARRAARNARRNLRLGACRRAVGALRDIRRTGGNDPSETGRLVVSTLRAYLADRLDIPGAGLTPGDAAELLSRKGVPPEIVTPFRDVLQRNFDAVYQAGDKAPVDPVADCDHAAEFLEKIDGILAAGDTNRIRGSDSSSRQQV